jgi:hypothetical protein
MKGTEQDVHVDFSLKMSLSLAKVADKRQTVLKKTLRKAFANYSMKVSE